MLLDENILLIEFVVNKIDTDNLSNLSNENLKSLEMKDLRINEFTLSTNKSLLNKFYELRSVSTLFY